MVSKQRRWRHRRKMENDVAHLFDADQHSEANAQGHQRQTVSVQKAANAEHAVMYILRQTFDIHERVPMAASPCANRRVAREGDSRATPRQRNLPAPAAPWRSERVLPAERNTRRL